MRNMKGLATLLLCGAMALGCGRNKDLDKKMKEANEKKAAAAKAEDEKKEAEKIAKIKKEAAEAKKAAEEAARRKAEAPKGNTAKTSEVASTDDEKALLAELAKAGGVANPIKRCKKSRKRIEPMRPMLLKALNHQLANVRFQAVYLLLECNAHGPDLVEAWNAAFKAEADGTVLGNWSERMRYYVEPEQLAVMLPTLHKSFKWTTDYSARAEVGKALMKLQYEPAVKDVYAALGRSTESMEKRGLLEAIKFWPRQDGLEAVLPFMTDSDSLVRKAAEGAKSAIGIAAEKEAEAKKE